MPHKNTFDMLQEFNPQKRKGPLPDLIQNADKYASKPKQKANKHQFKFKYCKQTKGVPVQPHPLDRRSGTGFGKELKKEGGGGLNWGTYKDELKRQDDADMHDLFQKLNEEELLQNTETDFTYYQCLKKLNHNNEDWILINGEEEIKELQIEKELQLQKLAKEQNLILIYKKVLPEDLQLSSQKKRRNQQKK